MTGRVRDFEFVPCAGHCLQKGNRSCPSCIRESESKIEVFRTSQEEGRMDTLQLRLIRVASHRVVNCL